MRGMPFTFIDIEERQRRRIALLFASLVLIYFSGAWLIYVSSGLGFFRMVFNGGAGVLGGYGRWPGWKTNLVILAVAFLAAFLHWTLSTRKMVDRLLIILGARPADPEDRYHLTLRNVVEEVSAASGGRQIETFVVNSKYLNAFAISDFSGRAVLGITEGLLVRLNRSQLEAIVGHEAGHILWGDSLESTVTCSMAAVYAGLLKISLSGWDDEGGALSQPRGGVPFPGFLLVLVIGVMRFLTLLLNTRLSREREFRADATTVRLTRNPLGLAEALHVISESWRGGGLPAESVGQIFIVNPRSQAFDEQSGFLADLFSTHPPTGKRIDARLKMAHTDRRTMVSGIRERPRTGQFQPLSSTTDRKAWYAMRDREWTGPFGLVDLATLGWLTPKTWVSAAGDRTVKPAHEFPEINRVFKRPSPSTATASTCPLCRSSLDRVYYEGVPIWRCMGCEGRLIRREQLPRIIIREEMEFSPEVREATHEVRIEGLMNRGRYVPLTPPTLPCPSCGRVMDRAFYWAILPYRVEMDVCPGCDLIWFDRHELEIIQCLSESFSGSR